MSERITRGVVLLAALGLIGAASWLLAPAPPAAEWGSDHVGGRLPEYITGDECLFCHRMDVGTSWGQNPHQRTIRSTGDDGLLILGTRHQRYLRPGDAYGTLDLRIDGDPPTWDAHQFADRCAGCHTTAVDGKSRRFSAVSIDCCACHGDVPLAHAKDGTLAHLAPKRADRPEVVISICGQCHIRSGTARSTGRPYPNQFVAGDNLFRDFAVDLTPAAIRRENWADAHVLDNVRAVRAGDGAVTCLSCHDVHAASSRKHQHLPVDGSCALCHGPGEPRGIPRRPAVHSRTCGY